METEITPTEQAWQAIQGGYDLHVHIEPDVMKRRIDDLDLAKEFLQRGLRGFVLKSHYVSTAERAKVVTKAVPGIEVYGAITLNHAIGGLNPVAVEIAGRSGCKIVWMPTFDALNETGGLPGATYKKVPQWAQIQQELAAAGIAPPRITVLDANGELTADTKWCVELIAKHDMVLATGHLGRDEIFALVKAAKAMKVRKVLVTHAEYPTQNLTADEQVQLADMGAIIEHCFTTMHTGKATWEAVLDSIYKVGPSRCLLSTDLGQPTNPQIWDGLAMFAQKLLENGFSVAQIRQMMVENPAAYLANVSSS